MLFGHNTNVSVGGRTFHVQTEDLGASHALIDTAVYFRGRVLHRRTSHYSDLLPLDPDREQALKLRVDEQHRKVVEELRSGRLKLTVPENEKPPALKAAPSAAPIAAAAPNVLHLDLLNARTWLTGKRALLQIAVRDPNQQAVEGAKVIARVEGAAQPAEYYTETGPMGSGQIEFDMPRLAGQDIALVIECFKGTARGHLRFHLRAKPHVPRPS